MKNILFITTSNFPYGGPSANVLRLFTTGLVKAGRNVRVLLQRGKQFGKINSGKKRQDIIEGVSYRYCGYILRPKSFLKKIIDTSAGLIVPLIDIISKKLNHKIDCVILYTSTAFECIPPFIACKILRIPVLNHVVEWYEKTSVAPSLWKLPRWWDFLFRMKILNKYFDGLIVTSRFLKDYYERVKVKSDRIFILPNLIDVSLFGGNESSHIKKSAAKRIGYCGFPSRKDGIDDLLYAFEIVQRKYPDSELLIVGDAADRNSLLPRLKQFAKELCIFKSVHFTGLVEWKSIPGLLKSCDILVLARPSGRFAEAGFPTKLGEYMACRIPVVSTKVGDIPFYLKDNENIIFANPNNPESIASKIRYLIDNPERARKVGENGYLWAKNELGYLEKTKMVGGFLDSFIK